jgi:hypothetical protein
MPRGPIGFIRKAGAALLLLIALGSLALHRSGPAPREAIRE